MENTPTLETERLILRQFTEDDVQAVFDIFSDKEVNTFLPWFPLETVEEAQRFLQERYLPCYQKPEGWQYAVCLKDDNIPVGYIGMSLEDSHDLGYGLRKEFWRQGIMTEAGKAVIQRLRESGVPYITATHDRNNPRSGAVMKRLGMRYQYSYEEQWQPKNIPVVFRLYQLNLDGSARPAYPRYWEMYEKHFIESDITEAE